MNLKRNQLSNHIVSIKEIKEFLIKDINKENELLKIDSFGNLI